MSDLITLLEKRIYENKPDIGSQGQYNYGRVNDFDSFKIMGKSRSSRDNSSVDLYTKLETVEDQNLINYPNGILNGRNSKIEFLSAVAIKTGGQTSDDTYYSSQWAFYMYDPASDDNFELLSLDAFNGSGDKIQSGIGTGNGFGQTEGNHRIGYRNWGHQYEHSHLTQLVYGESSEYSTGISPTSCEKFDVYDVDYCGPGIALQSSIVDSSDGSGNTFSKKFHLGGGKSSTATDFSRNKFRDALQGNYINTREDNIIMLTRTSADEKEYGILGHGWGGLGSGYENDERDRIYVKSKVPKSKLYEIWKEQSGQVKVFNFSHYGSSERSHNAGSLSALNEWDKTHNYRDSYGNADGHHEWISENDFVPVNSLRSVQIKVTAPTFNPVHAIKEKSEGGSYSNWVKKGDTRNFDPDGKMINEGWWCLDTTDETLFPNGERRGVHPRYFIDFVGWPDKNYSDSTGDGKIEEIGHYFHAENIKNYRPISFVTSHGDVDLQGYYENDTTNENTLRSLSSAPNTARLKFKIAKSSGNTNVQYVDIENLTNEDGSPNHYADFEYWFYVINWDWKEGDPGGGADCEDPDTEIDCLADAASDFPTTSAELESRMATDNTYNISKIGNEYYCYGDPEANKYCKTLAATGAVWDGESCGDGGVCDMNPDEETYLEHPYVEPGVYVIKAIVLSTLDINDKYTTQQYYWNNGDEDNPSWGKCTDFYGIYHGEKDLCEDNGNWLTNEDYTNYAQAIKWHLVTIKINFTADGAFPLPDFDSVGGEEYTYIPYPDTKTVNTSIYENYLGSGGAPLYSEQQNTYKSSHPLVSGLSSDSKYVNSIRKMVKEDKFGDSEVSDKLNTIKAKNLGPDGYLNELGDYLGQSDIAQIRLFNNSIREDGRPLDMTTFLEMGVGLGGPGSINELVEAGTNPATPQYDGIFHPYYDTDYWTGNPEYTNDIGQLIPSEPKFREESPVGDIFISEYDHYKDLCLLELNLGILDGKTIYDSSGNGNKGILIGDFGVKKGDIGIPPARDSAVKTPKVKKKPEEGAF
jgi:hypothetical protein